ncbi:MAG: T9SS type B sorting domain-containing protein, partial [Bacteroidota bacterium]
GDTDYTFTPNDPSQCGEAVDVTVTITETVTPTFGFTTTYCEGATPDLLPAVSDNGITGTWSDPNIDTATNGDTDYTFTPNDPSQCGEAVDVTVTITGSDPTVFPYSNNDVCQASQLPLVGSLNNIDDNGVTGNWGVADNMDDTHTYTFTPDDTNCYDAFDFTVTVTGVSISVTNSTDPSTCGGNDGQMVLEFTGLGNNDYIVDYDGGTLDVFVNNGTAFVNGLPQGDYNNLSITHNGCTSLENPSVTLNDPILPTIAVVSFTDPSTCGGNDGQIVLEFTGLGNNDYVVNYDGGTFNVFINDGTAYINGLSEGDYNNLSITHNGCTSLENPNVILADPITPTIEATDFRNPTTCGGEDGQIVLRITGVNNNFYDIVYDGGVFNDVFVNGSADFARIDNVPQGTYNNLRITNNGCTSVENPNVTLVDPTPPDAPIASDQSFCAGDNPTGAQLIPAINDGFTWYSDAALTSVVSASDTLNTQNYYVSRTENGCEGPATTVSITINMVSISSVDISHESCWGSGDGYVDVIIENGASPFTVQLNSEQVGVFSNDVLTITELNPGSYSLDISDSNGCEITVAFEILPSTPNLEATVNPVYTCESGLPVSTLEVFFEDPTVQQDVLYALDSTDPEDFVLTAEFGNINAGPHFLSIMHTNGCMVSIPFTIENVEPLGLNLTNSSPSEIVANAFGGAPPYIFYFQDAAGTENNVFPVNGDGVYTVRVVDANGCEALETLTITIPEIEVPNFFTPNNDGQNDFWGPRNTEGYPNLKTFIFDRYGRKIYIIGDNSPDWDGFYQDQPLPTGDYWYIINLNDGSGREIVGHFTLYR